MALKGHTRIELHNVKTGEDHIIESDNIVTNFAKELYGRLPVGNSSDGTQYFSSRPIDNTFGGILLFQDPIEENPNKYMIPYGSYMVGNATVNYASATTTSELGAYNAEESTYTQDDETGTCVRKYVYDFGTSKANGTISSVCLTNPYVGYFGFGNHSGEHELNMHSTWDLLQSRFSRNSYFTSENGITNGEILFGDYNKDVLYAYPYGTLFNGNNLELYECNLMCKKLNLFTMRVNTLSVNKKITIPVPTEIPRTPTNYCAVGYGEEYVYILIPATNSETVANNATFYVFGLKYDLSDTIAYTMTNKTGNSIRLGGTNTANGLCHISVKNGYLIVYSTTGRLFKIKLNDSTDVSEITDVSGGSAFSITTQERLCFEWLSDTPTCHKVVQHSNDYLPKVINLEDNKVYPINGRPIKAWSATSTLTDTSAITGNAVKIFNSSIYCSVKAYGSDGLNSSTRYFSRDPFMLSTINNLDEPVTKTSDMTMKITYTLTGSF